MTHYDNKPSLAELAHFGVKGMHWGVHKKEEPTGNGGGSKSTPPKSNKAKAATPSGSGKSTPPPARKVSSAEHDATKAYMAAKSKQKPLNKHEAAATLAANQKKFLAKVDPDNPKYAEVPQKKGLTPAQKNALIKGAIGVAAVGGLMALSYYGNKQELKFVEDLKGLAGKSIDKDMFLKGVSKSKTKTWGFEGFIQDSSFQRQEFTLPAGHTFHRITTRVEESFNTGTYATHNIEDFHRYVTAFRGEKLGLDLHHTTFKTTEPLKVPSLTTVLETLREQMGPDTTHEAAISQYNSWSGGQWNSLKHEGLFEALTKKGYGAIVDEMDAGVIGESPVVVFAKHLTSKVAEPLTNDLIDLAESSLIELANRKI